MGKKSNEAMQQAIKDIVAYLKETKRSYIYVNRKQLKLFSIVLVEKCEAHKIMGEEEQ